MIGSDRVFGVDGGTLVPADFAAALDEILLIDKTFKLWRIIYERCPVPQYDGTREWYRLGDSPGTLLPSGTRCPCCGKRTTWSQHERVLMRLGEFAAEELARDTRSLTEE